TGTRPLPRSLKVLIVFLIVLSHYWIRDYASTLIQLDQRSFYSARYAAALALVFGKGFSGLPLPDVREAQPIKDFLSLKRNALTGVETEEYLRKAYYRQPAENVASTRILDIRLAAFIWKIFGISWSPVFRFYILLSSLVCLLIFFMAQKLSGSFWG